ncbi:MAG: phosphatidate cytidylyltransferase [Planctomycetaceae bacterium]
MRNQPDFSGGEVCRKLLHMSPGLLPFALTWIEHPDPLDSMSLGVVTVLCAVLTAVFLVLRRVVRRPGEDNLLSTALSYPATILATLYLFPAHAELAAVVVVVLAFGDGSAYIGGKLLGRHPLPWNPRKTWAGLVAFLAVSAPLAAWAYALEARPEAAWGTAAAVGGLASLAGAAAESLPVKLTDNLRVGLAAAVCAAAVHFALAA